MRKHPFSYPGFICGIAALLAVSAPGTPAVQAAAARLSDAALLASQLPNGETLAAASMKDVDAAVRTAVAKRPGAARDIIRIAILAKTPKNHAIDCDLVRDILASALASVPQDARVLSEMALSLAPDCGNAIAQAVRTPVTGTIGGIATTGAAVPGSTTGEAPGAGAATGASGGDFGAGFGPGFPGSPGFSGSSPSGGFALPTPAPPAVTSVVNS